MSGSIEIGFALEHLGDALGLVALPVRSRDHGAGGDIAGRAAARVSEIECVHVDELQREISRFLDRRIADDKGLCAKVHCDEGIGRIAVRVTIAVSCGV